METSTIIIISLLVIIFGGFYYFLIKGNSELNNLRKIFTKLSLTQIKELLLKLKRDGVIVDDELINKISLHFNLQPGELINEVRLMNNEVIKPITVGDLLINAGSDLKSVLNTTFFFLLIVIILFVLIFLSCKIPSTYDYSSNNNFFLGWGILMGILFLF